MRTIIFIALTIGLFSTNCPANEPYWNGYDDAQEGFWKRSDESAYLNGFEHGQQDLASENRKKQPLQKQQSKKENTPRKRLRTNEVIIQADHLGGYTAVGKINGREVTFIVDTGASFVSLSKKTADELKLKYSKKRPIQMQTAAGVDKAYLTTIKKISIGPIVLRNIKAVVSTHNFPSTPLLGMTFLGKLEIQQKDSQLKLRKR